jgi:hypothetical protein
MTKPIPTDPLAHILAQRAAAAYPPMPRRARRSSSARGAMRCARQYDIARKDFARYGDSIAGLPDDGFVPVAHVRELIALGIYIAGDAATTAHAAADFADAAERLGEDALEAARRRRELAAAVMTALRKHDGTMHWRDGNPAADAVVCDVLAAMIAAEDGR